MSSHSLSIRNHKQSDITIMFNIWKEAVLATHYFLTSDEIESIGLQVKEYLANASFLVVTNSEVVLGFMGMTENKIDSLFVDPKNFGKGIGKYFIKHALSHHAQLYVDVNEDNHQAKIFYEKMGFIVIDRSETDDEGRPFPILKMKYR
jgi:putative acetyltransferase